jgi:SSS family transporter
LHAQTPEPTQLLEPQPHFGFLDYAALGAYLVALIVMGVYFARREKSTADFFLAGRRIPWWAAGLSIFGTQLSAITYMAIPAKAYATDWVYILGNMCILLICPVIVFCYLPFYRRLNVTTAYEYLERRFSLPVRLFSSAAFMLYQLARMGIVICLPAIALSTVTGFNVYVCILLMGVLATVYTVLGGIEAVIWTDVLQVFVLMGGALLSVIIIAANVDGGFGAIISTGMAEGKFHTFNWTWDIATMGVWVVVVGNLFSNLLPYTADQTVIQRYLTTRDEKQAARSIWTNGILAIPTALIFFGLGTCLFVFYEVRPELLSPALKTDAIFPFFIAQQLPVGVSGLVIAGLFAASMSSLDSSMNSIATAMVTDFYRRFRPQSSDHFRLNLARWLTAILGVIGTSAAIVIAGLEMESLWDLFIKVLGLIFSPVAGILALGIFTRRAHGIGALIGGVTSAIVLYLVQQHAQIHFFLWGAVGIMSCFAVGYLASLIIPIPAQRLEGLTVYTIGARNESEPEDAA